MATAWEGGWSAAGKNGRKGGKILEKEAVLLFTKGIREGPGGPRGFKSSGAKNLGAKYCKRGYKIEKAQSKRCNGVTGKASMEWGDGEEENLKPETSFSMRARDNPG